MTKDIIQATWNKAKTIDKPLSREKLAGVFKPAALKQTKILMLNIRIYLIFILITIVLDFFNIAGYVNNSGMLLAQVAMTVVAFGFLTFGLYLYREVRRMDLAVDQLLVYIQRWLLFYKTKYEIWHFMIAGTVLLMIFAINTLVDNDNGNFSINNPQFFAGLLIGIFVLVYVSTRASMYLTIENMKALLTDLESQSLEETGEMAHLQKMWRSLAIVFISVCTVLLIMGIWISIQILNL